MVGRKARTSVSKIHPTMARALPGLVAMRSKRAQVSRRPGTARVLGAKASSISPRPQVGSMCPSWRSASSADMPME